MKTVSLCVIALFCTVSTLWPDGVRQAVSYESLGGFDTPRSVTPAPNGRHLLFATYRIDPQTGAYSGNYQIMKTDGSEMRKLPDGMQSATWSEDGLSIFFLSWQNGTGQLFKMELESGKITQLTRIPGGIGNYTLIPDGSGILFSNRVFPENNSLDYAREKEQKAKAQKHSGMIYDRLLMRPYYRWDDGKVSHVFRYLYATDEVSDLTPGGHSAPASHLGGRHDLTVSPDSQTVAYTCNTDENKAFSTNNDIFLADIDGRNSRRLTLGRGNDTSPAFSPNGRFLAYLEMATPGYESEQKDLVVVDLKTDRRRNLSSDLDLPVNDFVWSRSSRLVYAICKEKGYDALYEIDTHTGKTICRLRERVFSHPEFSPDEKAFYAITSNLDRPPEIARFDLGKKTATVLTHLADQFVATHALGRSEVVWFKGGNGDDVMAFVTLPPGFTEKEKYPLLFLFHGGPEGDWDGSWSNYVGNVQQYAAAGYIVVKPNLHAATSYGRRFHEAIQNNWGIIDQADVDGCIDFLCATRPYIDSRRIAAIGRSYGGFLVNWLNGNSDRFACFVSIDGLFDQLMFYYSTDELWFPEKEFGGTPYQNREEYLRASPSSYVQNFRTPTLILHGGRDYRVDLSQGIGMFTALKRQGVPSRFICFPEEGHYFRSWHNWKLAYEEIFGWLNTHLKK